MDMLGFWKSEEKIPHPVTGTDVSEAVRYIFEKIPVIKTFGTALEGNSEFDLIMCIPADNNIGVGKPYLYFDFSFGLFGHRGHLYPERNGQSTIVTFLSIPLK